MEDQYLSVAHFHSLVGELRQLHTLQDKVSHGLRLQLTTSLHKVSRSQPLQLTIGIPPRDDGQPHQRTTMSLCSVTGQLFQELSDLQLLSDFL